LNIDFKMRGGFEQVEKKKLIIDTDIGTNFDGAL
jgi:hypothetical protein